MNYEEDWLMRQIKMMVDFTSKLIKGLIGSKMENMEEEEIFHYKKLTGEVDYFLRNKDINEAENLLFKQIDKDKIIYLKIGMDFYDRINRLSDKELEEADFSREEIELGLRDLFDIYDIDYIN